MTNENNQQDANNDGLSNDNLPKEEVNNLGARLKILKQQLRINKVNPYIILTTGVIVAGVVLYLTGNLSNFKITFVENNLSFGSELSDNVKPISSEDHIKGDLNAPVKIVEFSDLECPFCKRFHSTMQQVIDEYGKSGQVAWIYRHFPLDYVHSKARREAAAAELANELGGNDKFWAYVDRIFEITPSNDGLDLSLLPQIAEEVGLPRKPFEDLLAENDIPGGKYAEHIESDYQDSIDSGGSGTPYSIVIAPNGKTFTISGAQPYSAVKSIIELALKEK